MFQTSQLGYLPQLPHSIGLAKKCRTYIIPTGCEGRTNAAVGLGPSKAVRTYKSSQHPLFPSYPLPLPALVEVLAITPFSCFSHCISQCYLIISQCYPRSNHVPNETRNSLNCVASILLCPMCPPNVFFMAGLFITGLFISTRDTPSRVLSKCISQIQ